MMRKYVGGVTLMELLIVVVIIGILTAIAFPNYREFVTRAKRNEAKAALLKCATNPGKILSAESGVFRQPDGPWL
jgi:type IV pilus assembly protein PilE